MTPPIVVLAGGLGTRLRSLTGEAPKALADVGGVPMLRRFLQHWRSRGARRAVLCLGYRAEGAKHVPFNLEEDGLVTWRALSR